MPDDEPWKRVVVHADDLGLTRSFNAGIREAATRGWLTSTCVRVNAPAFDEAIREVLPECPRLGVGIHLNLVEGRTTRRRVPRSSPLCDIDGTYRLSFARLLRMQRDSRLIEEVELDYRDQIEIALGRVPSADHLNSHQHSHAVPALFEIVCRLALEYGVPFVRLPRERFYTARAIGGHLHSWYVLNLAKSLILNRLARTNLRVARAHGVATNDWMVGILYTGYMNADTVVRGLRAAAAESRIVEVLLHPTLQVANAEERYLDDEVRDYALHPARAVELQTLLDAAVARQVESAGWRATNYRDLATSTARAG